MNLQWFKISLMEIRVKLSSKSQNIQVKLKISLVEKLEVSSQFNSNLKESNTLPPPPPTRNI